MVAGNHRTRFPSIRTRPLLPPRHSSRNAPPNQTPHDSSLLKSLLPILLQRIHVNRTANTDEVATGVATDDNEQTGDPLPRRSNARANRHHSSRSRSTNVIPRDATLDSVSFNDDTNRLTGRPSEEASSEGEASPTTHLCSGEDLLPHKGSNRIRTNDRFGQGAPLVSGTLRHDSPKAAPTIPHKSASAIPPPSRQSSGGSDASAVSTSSIPTPPLTPPNPRKAMLCSTYEDESRSGPSSEESRSGGEAGPAVTMIHYPEDGAYLQESDDMLDDQTLDQVSPLSIETELDARPQDSSTRTSVAWVTIPDDKVSTRDPIPAALERCESPVDTRTDTCESTFTYKVLPIHGTQCLVKIIASFTKPRSTTDRIPGKVVTDFHEYAKHTSAEWKEVDLAEVPTVASNTYYPSNEVGSYIAFTLHQRGVGDIPRAIECIARIERVISPAVPQDTTDPIRYIFKEPCDGDIYIEKDRTGASEFAVFRIVGVKLDRFNDEGLMTLRSLVSGKLAGHRRKDGLVGYHERRPYQLDSILLARYGKDDNDFQEMLLSCLGDSLTQPRMASIVSELRSQREERKKEKGRVVREEQVADSWVEEDGKAGAATWGMKPSARRTRRHSTLEAVLEAGEEDKETAKGKGVDREPNLYARLTRRQSFLESTIFQADASMDSQESVLDWRMRESPTLPASVITSPSHHQPLRLLLPPERWTTPSGSFEPEVPGTDETEAAIAADDNTFNTLAFPGGSFDSDIPAAASTTTIPKGSRGDRGNTERRFQVALSMPPPQRGFEGMSPDTVDAVLAEFGQRVYDTICGKDRRNWFATTGRSISVTNALHLEVERPSGFIQQPKPAHAFVPRVPTTSNVTIQSNSGGPQPESGFVLMHHPLSPPTIPRAPLYSGESAEPENADESQLENEPILAPRITRTTIPLPSPDSFQFSGSLEYPNQDSSSHGKQRRTVGPMQQPAQEYSPAEHSGTLSQQSVSSRSQASAGETESIRYVVEPGAMGPWDHGSEEAGGPGSCDDVDGFRYFDGLSRTIDETRRTSLNRISRGVSRPEAEDNLANSLHIQYRAGNTISNAAIMKWNREINLLALTRQRLGESETNLQDASASHPSVLPFLSPLVMASSSPTDNHSLLAIDNLAARVLDDRSDAALQDGQ